MPYPCLCCGYLTRDEPSNGDYDICPVCFWEDDPVQAEDHNYGGGANVLSLYQARKNFKKYGAMEERFVKDVRKPKDKEIPKS
ncbi:MULTISPECIES: CPCC family cysteine-rich protein [unclassified Acinetobacter]|uniref:CPCC family cysteine-rich protein n=1 Tax=unclassified Acinetobacter TaxID=196816 RepID=UPI00244BA65B|nr:MULTISPECIES: CPCC family cysteine-rich protein [unclassified Acinetobacter]MDH0032095.1 CPCC family cysteine-rich protein [Acinetobacter sp. GD04021]MDH0887751.1 CPCC family cysteine-rich protein [Acinetobacter sp. GD03873]MDH1084099.1 CPCC family cysteine-rich protein [Acinetobacter sp. GD03983]MDH2190974.1 CPCC family cysteine-rich protein [Acinetobacter sp. GD03645]MDH2204611.1 CPCC family cysteine-rich protein [Acinetobacter sp. GD03647]